MNYTLYSDDEKLNPKRDSNDDDSVNQIQITSRIIKALTRIILFWLKPLNEQQILCVFVGYSSCSIYKILLSLS